jgi:hypothetical protein
VVGQPAIEASRLVEIDAPVGFRRTVVDPTLELAAAAQLEVDPRMRAAHLRPGQPQRA